MNDRNKHTDQQSPHESELLSLFEQLTDLVLRGDEDECRRLIERYPEYAQQLESVMPALQVMHEAKSGDTLGLVPAIPKDDPHLSLKGRLGDFRLIREVGRGGMGVVYEAEQILLERRVAVKVLPLAAMVDERQRKRFQNEARAAATLNHTHIVPIYFVGVDRGIHYYAMQYIPGQSLNDVLRHLRKSEEQAASGAELDSEKQTTASGTKTVVDLQAELSTLRNDRKSQYFQSVAKLAADVADALQHAHDCGIVHRDVKPSNLLLDNQGNCLISDFGLARLEEDSSLTMTGDVLGTLRYAPPEQVLGQQAEIDHRADIYSLGATLYELLSLHPAMDGTSKEQLLKQVSESNPKRLSQHDRAIPHDLETIVQKAMESDPEDRFASATEMARELRHFIAGRPLQVRRPDIAQRVLKWIRRHPKITLSSFLVVAVFLIAATLGLIAFSREQEKTAAQRDAALENLQLAMSALDEVYQEIGSNWIDSERALTDTQAKFLSRSARLLNEIAGRFPEDSQFYVQAGLTHFHAANANTRIHDWKLAYTGYDKASALLAKALDVQPDNDSLREVMVDVEVCRGKLCMEMWDYAQAEESLASAAEHLRALMGKHPDVAHYNTNLASIETERLRLLSLDWRDAEVIAEGTALLKRLEDLRDPKVGDLDSELMAIRFGVLVSESMRRAGNATGALSLCQRIEKETFRILQDSPDDRTVIRTLAALETEIGYCQLELNALELARERFRKGMSQLRRSFVFDGTPKEISIAYMERKATHDQMEPRAFLQYADAQLGLARALFASNQTDLGREQADESFRTCFFLAGLFKGQPNYLVEVAKKAVVLAEWGELLKHQSTMIEQTLMGLSFWMEVPRVMASHKSLHTALTKIDR